MRRTRLALFAVGAAGLGVLLLFGVAGLPDFGRYRGAYGDAAVTASTSARHVTEAVGGVTFDIRAVDSLGEETILFAAVVGVAVVLREQRDEEDEEEDVPPERSDPSRGHVSDAVRMVGFFFLPATVVLGLYLVAHGLLSPGGGFQGGVVVAGGLVLLFVAGDERALREGLPETLLDPADATGLAAYVIIGVVGLVAGVAMFDNVLPYGSLGRLTSGGMMPLLSTAVGLEVAAALLLVARHFLDQLVRMSEPRSVR